MHQVQFDYNGQIHSARFHISILSQFYSYICFDVMPFPPFKIYKELGENNEVVWKLYRRGYTFEDLIDLKLVTHLGEAIERYLSENPQAMIEREG